MDQHEPPPPDDPKAVTAEDLAALIKAHRSEILAEWDAGLRREPWINLPREFRIDHMPEVITSLVEVSLGNRKTRAERMREVREAARHGEQRRKLGLDERFILFEYYLLQQVLTRFVQIHAAPKAARHAIVHLDESIRFATYASIRGYHRGTFEKRGEWPATVERLADEWAA